MTKLKKDCKPFLKWAGGKTQLLGEIEKALPKEIYTWNAFTYIEPFDGSGAQLFWMIRNFPNLKKAVINDINPDLMTAYKVIKKQPKQLIKVLNELQSHYYAILKEEKRKEYFLSQREKFNANNHDEVENTALLIFLNRTCFNGLYRVNSKGLFNVPFGKYSNPTICDEKTILADSTALKKVILLTGDFEETINYAVGKTFFYFDPHYKPLSNTSSFSSYAKDAFNDEEQERLKHFLKWMGCKTKLLFEIGNALVENISFKNFYLNTCEAIF